MSIFFQVVEEVNDQRRGEIADGESVGRIRVIFPEAGKQTEYITIGGDGPVANVSFCHEVLAEK